MIKVSVIIPIFNVEEYLRKCIESVLRQTLKEIEIVCVDDGSTDNSNIICDEYAKLDSRVKVIHKYNGGLVSARKEGLKIAKGEYIGYVDGDDWIDPEMYEKLYEKACAFKADVVCSGIEYMRDSGCSKEIDKLPVGIYFRSDKRICNHLYDIDKRKRMIGCALYSKLYKRKEFYDFQMNVDNSLVIGEDLACTYPFLVNASVVYITDFVFYHYRRRKNSLTKIKRYEYIGDVNKILLALRNSFMKHERAKILLKQLDYIIFELLIEGGYFYLDSNIKKTYKFPYDKVKKDSRIVLYGAGKVGVSYYEQIQESKFCDIILWVDKNYMNLCFLNKDVKNVEKIKKNDFDKILIAMENTDIAEKIKNELEKDFPELKYKFIVHKPKVSYYL